jgi:hypothetical protein
LQSRLATARTLISERTYLEAKAALAAVEADAIKDAGAVALRQPSEVTLETKADSTLPSIRVEDPASARTIGRELAFVIEGLSPQLEGMRRISNGTSEMEARVKERAPRFALRTPSTFPTPTR